MVRDLWCRCNGVKSFDFGSHWTYVIVNVENIGSDTIRRRGQTAKLAFIPTKLTLHGKLYTANGEIFNSPLFKVIVPEVVERKYLPPRWTNGCMCSQFGAGWWFLGKESFVSGFQAKPNYCKLVIVLNTFFGQRKPISLLKHLFNASKGTICFKFEQII